MKNTISYFPIIHDVCYRLFNKLKRLASTGNKIQVQEEMMRFTVDITSTVAFGFPMNTLDGKDDVIQQHLQKIFPMINHRINSLIPLWKIIKSKKVLGKLSRSRTLQTVVDYRNLSCKIRLLRAAKGPACL